MKKQKFPLLLGPRNRNDMRENNRNDKRNFERRDGKKRDFKGKRDYRDRDRKQEVQQADEEFTGGMVEGRNAVIEAFRSGKTVDKLFVLASSQDGPIRTIIREAKKHDTIINYVEKERLDELSTTGKHQGVIAQVASYSYATVEDILARAEEKGEPPFILSRAQRRKESRHLSFCWTALRIRITSVRSSVPQTWQAHMVSSCRSTAQSA